MTSILNSLMSGGYIEDDFDFDDSYEVEEQFENYVLSHSPETVTPFAPIEEDELPF